MRTSVVVIVCLAALLAAGPTRNAEALPNTPTVDSSGHLDFSIANSQYFAAKALSGNLTLSYSHTQGNVTYGYLFLNNAATVHRLGSGTWNASWSSDTIWYLFADASLSDSVDCWWQRNLQFSTTAPVALMLNTDTAWDMNPATSACTVSVSLSSPATVAYYDFYLQQFTTSLSATFTSQEYGFLSVTPRGGPTSVTVTMTPESGGLGSPMLAYVPLLVLGVGIFVGAVVVTSLSRSARGRKKT